MRNRRNSVLALLAMLAVCGGLAPAAGAEGPRAAYVANRFSHDLSTFDTFTNVVGTPIAAGLGPWGVAITPDGSTAYVANEWAASVTVIDTATEAVVASIPVGDAPRTIGITPDGTRAYVANYFSSSVTPIDIASNTAGAPIAVGSFPHGIAITPDGSRVYVASLGSNVVNAIDTANDTVSTAISTSSAPYTIAITPDGATAYVTSLGSIYVTPIDLATNTAGAAIPVGTASFAIAIPPDGATAYVAGSNEGTVIPIDTATNTTGPAIPIGSAPEGIAITPDGSTAYVTDINANTILPLDLATDTVGAPMPTGIAPISTAITPNQGPVAAFDASAGDALTATFDASATSDSDGTIANYAWDFGDGHSETITGPTASHAYDQPGDYTVTLTATDDEGCSDALVFTGQTASCNSSPSRRATHTVTFAGPATTQKPATPSAARQAIERFALDGPCVRRARDGKARIGLRLRLAKAGSVAIQVDRALTAKQSSRCPKRKPGRRYTGKLRRVQALENVNTQAVTASVQRRLTRSFELRPGLYRIAVRAYEADGKPTRAAYRWVRVLAGQR